MTLIGWIQIILYCVVLLALVKPLSAVLREIARRPQEGLLPAFRVDLK